MPRSTPSGHFDGSHGKTFMMRHIAASLLILGVCALAIWLLREPRPQASQFGVITIVRASGAGLPTVAQANMAGTPVDARAEPQIFEEWLARQKVTPAR